MTRKPTKTLLYEYLWNGTRLPRCQDDDDSNNEDENDDENYLGWG